MTDDFQERCARSIQIDKAFPPAALFIVQHLAGVFFQMDANDAHALRALGRFDLQPAIVAERQIVLADLVVLRQIGVVIILAVPFRERGNPAVKSQRCFQRQIEGLPVHHRQYTGHTDTDGARR